MIARTWRGRSTAEKTNAYARHFRDSVLPQLRSLPGHRGAWLLQRDIDGGTEFMAVTIWDSAESIRAFAGPDISKAHVEPRARAMLASFDDLADHYEIVVSSNRSRL